MNSKQSTTDSTAQDEVKDSQLGCCGAADEIHARLDNGHDRMDRIEESLNATRRDIAEVLEIIMLGKSFFKVAGFIGTFIRWSAGIGAPLVAIYMTVRGTK